MFYIWWPAYIVPGLIWIEHDLMDPRTVSRKTMRDKVNEYMRTVMRAEPVDPTLLDFDDEICM